MENNISICEIYIFFWGGGGGGKYFRDSLRFKLSTCLCTISCRNKMDEDLPRALPSVETQAGGPGCSNLSASRGLLRTRRSL